MPTTALALLGFLSQQAASKWLIDTCVLPDASDPATSAMWTAAQAALGPPVQGAGMPEILPIPQAGQGHINTLLQQPWVQQGLQSLPSVSGRVDFCLVEIDRLLAYQIHVDCQRSDGHGNGVPANPTMEQQLGLCLPIDPVTEPLKVHESPGSMMISSPSLNVRSLWRGLNNGFLGIHVGVTLPFVHVVRFNGRHYLHNGYHRAVALRARGLTHMPCVLREVATAADAGLAPPGTFDQQLLESANPPTLGHFTSGRAVQLTMKQFHRVLHISWAEYATSVD